MINTKQHWKTIGILGFTQIAAWGALYYAFAILAADIQRELGWRAEIVFGAFSWSLLVAGLAATPVGILLDRHGGRIVMGCGSLMCGAGLIALSMAHSILHYFAAWTVIGIAMAAVLYEAAFATITRQFKLGARKGISRLTLFGGLASTVFWPLTLKMNGQFGWRETYLIYGLLQLLVCAPLHAMLSGANAQAVSTVAQPVRHYTLQEAVRHPTFWKLAFAFATNSFVFSALSVHLIPLLQQFGHPLAAIVWFTALIGPLQVIGRIGEMTFADRTRPQSVGKITFGSLPAALLALLFLGQHQWAIAAFCALYGLGNGILTIVRGTIPQALFGTENYGAISGAMAGPSLVAKAAAPLAIAAVVQGSASPYPILIVLLATSVVSLGFYLAAIRVQRHAVEKSTAPLV